MTPAASPRRRLRTRRWAGAWLGAFSLFVGVVAFGGTGNESLRSGVPKGADFVAFFSAGSLLADGECEAVYSPSGIRERQRRFHPRRWNYRGLYPPPLYQAMEAAQPLPYPAAAALHLVGGSLLLAWAAWLLAGALGVDRWTAVALGAAGPAALLNVLTGQLAGLWALLLAVGVVQLRAGRAVLAGFALGWLCAKPQYGAVVALWLLLIGQPRALFGFALGGAGLLAASLAWGGWAPWAAWLAFLGGDHLGGFAPVPWRSISLPGLVHVPFREAAWTPALARGLSALALLAAVGVSSRARLDPSSDPWPRRAGAVLSLLLFSLPHMVEYDLAMHGLLLLAAAPAARSPRGLLFAAALLAPALGEVARLTSVPLLPLILGAWLAVEALGPPRAVVQARP